MCALIGLILFHCLHFVCVHDTQLVGVVKNNIKEAALRHGFSLLRCNPSCKPTNNLCLHHLPSIDFMVVRIALLCLLLSPIARTMAAFHISLALPVTLTVVLPFYNSALAMLCQLSMFTFQLGQFTSLSTRYKLL